MKKIFWVFAPLLLASIFAQGATISTSAGVALGGVWVDGYILNDFGVGQFTTPGDTDGSPFNQFIGSEFDDGSNFAASWNMNFDPAQFGAGPEITGANFTLGIFDHDALAGPADQVALFSINGVNLTALLNAQFNSRGGQDFEYNIYTFALPNTVFATLLTGTVNVTLNLQGNGRVFFLLDPQDPASEIEFETAFNAAGVDFSSLSIDYRNSTEPPSEIPEPGTMLLSGLGLLAAWAWKRRIAQA